jgi:hypothetical protein
VGLRGRVRGREPMSVDLNRWIRDGRLRWGAGGLWLIDRCCTIHGGKVDGDGVDGLRGGYGVVGEGWNR